MLRAILTLTAMAMLAGCSASSTQSLQEQTANATAAAKRDAVAITKGVAEGLTRKGPVNINTASEKSLEGLPGMTPEGARAIAAARPYRSTQELLRKHVVSREEFDRIKPQIVTQ